MSESKQLDALILTWKRHVREALEQRRGEVTTEDVRPGRVVVKVGGALWQVIDGLSVDTICAHRWAECSEDDPNPQPAD